MGLGDLAGGVSFDALGALLGSDTKDGEPIFQSTRVFASFHTDHGFDGIVDSTPELGDGPAMDSGGLLGGVSFDALSLLGDSDPQPMRIVGFQTHKTFGGSPGTWTLTVKSRNGVDLHLLWKDPEDVWVRIGVVKNGKPKEVVFGLIDVVTEEMSRGTDGSRDVTYTIQGSDFHKVFTTTELYINVHENKGAAPVVPLYSAVAEKLVDQRPDQIVKTLIDAWLGNNGVADKQWKLPQSLGGGFFYDMLNMDLQEVRGSIFDPALYSPDQMQGKSLWSTLEEYSNGLLNELFTVESSVYGRHPVPQLVMRERPFPSDSKKRRSWNALTTHSLHPGDVKGRQMSKGAPESRYNYWLLEVKGLLADGMGVQKLIQAEAARGNGLPGSAPIYNLENMRKHGFRKFMQSTRSLPMREKTEFLRHAARWLHLVHDWYAVAPFELNGTLELSAVFPAIQIGQRLLEKRSSGRRVEYYIEGVTHSWQYPGPGLTTLNLTRGEFRGVDLLDIVNDEANESFLPAADVAVGLAGNVPGNSVPHGSGPKLDRAIGQIDTPERIFLKQRGVIDEDPTHLERGELKNPRARRIRPLRPDDLPDQQIGEDAERAVGNAPAKRARKAGGNLTQRELEQGVRLPVRDGEPTTESASETEEQALARWKQSAKRGGRP